MSLKGLTFFVFGLDSKKKKEVTAFVSKSQGSISFALTKNVNYVITTQELLFNEKDSKIQAAKKLKIPIVKEEALSDIAAKNQQLLLKHAVSVSNSARDDLEKGVSYEATITVFQEKPLLPTAPTVNMVLPEFGPTQGEYKVALFGHNFVPNSKLMVKFGEYIVRQIEYHCASVIVATVTLSQGNAAVGEVPVVATNDGRHYGPNALFRFVDHTQMALLRNSFTDSSVEMFGQLSNVRRSIVQLQAGLANVLKVEADLSRKFTGVGMAPTIEAAKLTSNVQIESSKANLIAAAPVSHTTDIEREIRIFISSPFRDMGDERDLLVKNIIPKLRKLCMERDVVLSYVDLRWGVTEAQNQGAATLLMCMRELAKCNVFIGLYGERYGWCLSKDSVYNITHGANNAQDDILRRSLENASKEFPFIENFQDRSVTEIEMRTILGKHRESSAKAAWFYLRDPYYAESLAPDQKILYKSEGEYEKAKLDTLKHDILNSEYPTKQYNRPNALEDLIYDDLVSHINKKYPQGSELAPLQSERFRHQIFARSLARAYLPSEKMFMDIDKHVMAEKPKNTPLVLIGESGIGKSALLANWVNRYKQHHPENFVISHYIGCSPSSMNYVSFITRVMEEISDFVKDCPEINPDPVIRVKQFPSWLERSIKLIKTTIVLIVDGLDALDGRDNALDLLWFPQIFPSNVSVVISVAPGKVLDNLKKRNYESVTMEPLQEAERKSFIRMFLNLHSKKLSESQELKIANQPQCGNPRYLKTLLEDICVWGQYEQLDERIDNSLKAKTTSALYQIVLTRLEKDYDKEGKGLLRHFMSLLWASRRGLYQATELESLLRRNKSFDQKAWNSLFVVLEEMLFNAAGLLNFSNRDIRQAVEITYVPNIADQQKVHTELALFFAELEGYGERKLEEVPWQLEKSGQYDKLKECMLDLNMFYHLYTVMAHKFDLFRYWRKIGEHTKTDTVAALTNQLNYTDRFPHGVIVADLFYKVGNFFEEIGKYQGAVELYQKARHHFETSAQNLRVAKMEYTIARVLLLQAKYTESEGLLQRALAINIREQGADHLEVATVLNRLGSLYTDIGKFAEAEECLTKSLRIRAEKLGAGHSRVGQVLKHMLTFYEAQGNISKAMEVGNKALVITEQAFGPDDINISDLCVQLGRLHMAQRKFQEAKKHFKRALRIVETKLGATHPKAGDLIYELGCFYYVKPDEVGKAKIAKSWSSDKAEEWFQRALQVKRGALPDDHPDVARVLNRLGSLYIERTQYDKAEKFFQEALQIRIKKLGPMHARVAQTVKHMITLYELQEKYEPAIESSKKALEIYEKMAADEGNKPLTEGSPKFGCVNILIRMGEQYKSLEGWKSDNPRKILTKALERQVAMTSHNHPKTLEIIKMIDELKIPPPPPVPKFLAPPPPPPPPPEAAPLPPVSSARAALLAAIVGGAKGKANPLKSRKKAVRANEFAREGWWKQNYNYSEQL